MVNRNLKPVRTTSLLLLLVFFSFVPSLLRAQEMAADYQQMLDSLYTRQSAPILACELARLKNVYLLDARESEEFAVSHLKNARNVGYIWFDMRKVYNIPHDACVVVYCTAGWRSEKIAHKLERAGYTNVYNLYGGIFEWINEGYPVYRPDGIQTAEIHTYTADWARWLNRGSKVH